MPLPSRTGRPAKLVAALLVARLVLAPLAASAADGSVGDDVRPALRRDGGAVVLVGLDVPGGAAIGASWAERCAGYEKATEALIGDLPATGCSLRHRFEYSPVVTLRVTDPRVIDALERHPRVRSVELDLPGTGALEEAKAMTRADLVQGLGFAGAGLTVAVLDSGIDVGHAAFEGRIIAQQRILNQGRLVDDDAQDDHGHGTNVAGILAGDGPVTGLLPAADIVAVKILNSQNNGWISDWARGVEWVVRLHQADNGISVDIINMSLQSTDGWSDTCDGAQVAMANACAAARDAGILLFAAGGNGGSLTQLRLPACLSTVASVGCVHDTPPETICSFSDRGPLLDFLAPGSRIRAAGLGGGESTFVGSSQASPHAAGIAGLVLEAAPEKTAAEVIEVLRRSGFPIRDPQTERVVPRVDAWAALELVVPSLDCDEDGTYDGHQLAADPSLDCDGNSIPDTCDIAASPELDSNGDGRIDSCVVYFRRADVNQDRSIDVSDGVSILKLLFRGHFETSCLDAADVNDDERVDVADAVYTFSYLFRGGPAPATPDGTKVGECSIDETSGALGCDSFAECD